MPEKAQAAKEICCAHNGEDAFLKIHEIEAKAKSHEKSLCILLDLDMPVLDGYEFLEELKAAKINLKITIYVLSALFKSREEKKLKSFPILLQDS